MCTYTQGIDEHTLSPESALALPVVPFASGHMRDDTTTASIAACLALATVLGQGLVIGLTHGLALLIVLAELLTGRQLIRSTPAPAAAPAPADTPRDPLITGGQPLETQTVRELRALARSAGHKALARSGRRSDLLAALA